MNKNLKSGDIMAIVPYVEGGMIYFKDQDLNVLGETEYTDGLWDIVGNVWWSVVKKSDGAPKYLRSWKF